MSNLNRKIILSDFNFSFLENIKFTWDNKTNKEIYIIINISYAFSKWSIIFSYLEYLFTLLPTIDKANFLINNFLYDEKVPYALNISQENRMFDG